MSGKVVERVSHGARIKAISDALRAKPWQTRSELGLKWAQLERMYKAGRLVRRVGERKYNVYEYALKGTDDEKRTG